MHFEAEGIFHTISEPQPNSSYLQQRMDKLSLDGKGIDKSGTPLTRETPIIDSERWRKDNAKACYLITICLSQFDQERVRVMKTAAEKWTSLLSKYNSILPTSGRHYLQELVSYKMKENTTVQEAWGELLLLRDKVVMATPTLRDAFPTRQLFQLLLQSLPAEYAVIRDGIDAIGGVDAEIGIKRLEDKEIQLTQAKADLALLAKQKEQRREQRRPLNPSRSQSTFNNSRQERSRRHERSSSAKRETKIKDNSQKGCLICGEVGHWTKECEFLESTRSHVRSLAKKKKEVNKGKSSVKRHRSYLAGESEEEDENDSFSSGDNDDDLDDLEETAALSREAVCKIPRSKWVADSGASSHMTDKLQLFSGPLTKIRERRIKVGGGELRACHRGTCVIKDGHGNQGFLSSVLYVPKLGVNLLSGRRMCEKGLIGSFDQHGLKMHDKQGKEIMEARQRGGVYIVEKIAKDLDEFALTASMHHDIAFPSKVDIASLSSSSEALKPRGAGLTCPTTHNNMEIEIESTPALNPTKTDKHSETYRLWHRRFAHLGREKLRNLHKVTTLEKPIPVSKEEDHICEVCALTKLTNKRGKATERKTSLLALVSIDICGPLPASREGYTYFLEIVDNYSRKIWSIPLKRRDEAPGELRKWRIKVELQSAQRLLAVRSDNATELKATLDEWCSSIGIIPQYTVPHMSIQNGVAERAIRTTENSVRAMIKDAELPIEFWKEAMETDAYLRNRTGCGPIIDGYASTPEEAFTGVKPSIDHIRVWGCKCYSYVDPKSLPAGDRRDKFMDRGRIGVFMGYVEETTKQYRLWAPDMGKIIRSHVVKFDENLKGGSVDLNLRKQTPNVLPERRPVGRPQKTKETKISEPAKLVERFSHVEVSSQQNQTHDQPNPKDDVTQNVPPIPTSEESPIANDSIPAAAVPKASTSIFSHVAIPKRKRSDEDSVPEEPAFKIPRAFLALFADDNNEDEDGYLKFESALSADASSFERNIPEPKSYKEAVNDPVWGELWKEAVNTEIKALIGNKTWKEVVPPPKTNIVTCKWVFKVKTNLDGSLEKFKARLVARGFTQKYGIDYEDTFAPTVRSDTLRAVLAIVAMENLECHQVDVNNAFTQSTLKDVIYMTAPEGVNVAPGRVLQILQSLYGLKQSAREWNSRCTNELTKLGFIQCSSDPCLFTHPKKGIIIFMHVDDLVIASKMMKEIDWFKKEFNAAVSIKDLGEVSKVLGIRVTRDRKNRTLRMDQTHYLKDVMERTHMSADKYRPTEIPMNGYDSLRPAGKDDKRIDQREYQQIVGSLMYAAIHTRPDIAFALGRLSQYLSDPAAHHGHALKTLLRYVRSTIDIGILYGAGGNHGQGLIGYSDSDYAADRLERKSILGYVYMLGGGPISWMSRKQKSVATSTTEAEYMALSTCAKEGLWLVQLMKDIGFEKYFSHNVNIRENLTHQADSPMRLKGDNQAAIQLAKDAHIHDRSISTLPIITFGTCTSEIEFRSSTYPAER